MVAKKMWTALTMVALLGAGCGKSPKDMCKIRREVWTRCGTTAESTTANALNDATCAAEVEHASNAKLVSRFEKAAACAEDKDCNAIADGCDTMILPPSAIEKKLLKKVGEDAKNGLPDLGELNKIFSNNGDK